jgi:hypothetical protein
MFSKHGSTLAVVSALLLFVFVLAEDAGSAEKPKENVGLRDEQDVEKIRDEAISKLEKPLEKMKVKVGEQIQGPK